MQELVAEEVVVPRLREQARRLGLGVQARWARDAQEREAVLEQSCQ